MSRLWKLGLASLAVAAATAAAVAFDFNAFLNRPLSVQAGGETLNVAPGTSFRQVANQLAARGLLEKPLYFRLYARLTNKAGRIHVGEYEVEPGLTPEGLLAKLVTGNVRLYSFTIVEGWTFRELLKAMRGRDEFVVTLSDEDWPALLEELGAGANHPEGLFLPETYRIPRGVEDRELLRQAYELMQSVLDEEWAMRRDGLPLASPYEALILASIVEKETALAEERPRIAGVFVRRLQRGMRLQTDPTVIYGIRDFNGNLTKDDLQTDTPYNTYTRGGLPPTPIALPGRAAIHAALNPADGTEVYFVATGLGDGSHKFSDTKEQHDAAVREYLARQRANHGK